MHRLKAVEIRDQVRRGELQAEAVTQYFLQRIEHYDPKIGAFLSVLGERALKQARAIDEKRKRGEPLGALAGVPVAIKDNMHIEGELTTCASRFLSNYRAPFGSTAVQLLEAQDAVLIGKTNLDEFAMGSTTENSAFQVTRNPWDLNCVPGGSSGGSAAAVAARLVPLATGSDTGGSIRQPASMCGVVGFKPTYGRISRFGLVAFGSSLDQIGPFASCVEDAALAMEIMGQHDPQDSTSLKEPADSYSEHLDKGVDGWTVGVPWKFLSELSGAPLETFQKSLESLKALGARIVDVDLELLRHGISIYYIIAPAEAATNLARFDGVRYGQRASQAQTLEEVINQSRDEGFGYEVKKRILLGSFVLSSGYQDAYYRQAQRARTLVIQAYDKIFAQCDLVAMPVCPKAAFELGSVKDPFQLYLEDLYTLSCNLAGLPGISVPAGFCPQGKPIGLQLIGPQKGDVKVCQAARAFEALVQQSSVLPPLFEKEPAL